MTEETENGNGGDRLYLRPTKEVLDYLADAAKVGIYGKKQTDVALFFIGLEIERLIRDGILKQRTGP